MTSSGGYAAAFDSVSLGASDRYKDCLAAGGLDQVDRLAARLGRDVRHDYSGAVFSEGKSVERPIPDATPVTRATRPLSLPGIAPPSDALTSIGAWRSRQLGVQASGDLGAGGPPRFARQPLASYSSGW